VLRDRGGQLLAEADLRKPVRHVNRVLDRLGVRAAVADQRDAVDPQQRRAAVLGVVDAPLEPPQRRGHQRGADLGQKAAAHHLVFDHVQHHLGGALDALQDHVAGETVGHHHVDFAAEDVAALDVTQVIERRRAARRARQQLVRVARERRALVLLRAVGEQPDLGPRLAVQEPRVDRAEHAGLSQHRRLGVDVGAHVEQRAFAGLGRKGGDDRRTLDAGQTPEHEQPARHHRARVAGGHDCVGLAGLAQIEAHAHRRLLLLLHRHRRRVVHGDDFGRVADRDLLAGRTDALELGAHARLVADDNHVDPFFADGRDDPLDLDARRAVRSHRVNGDRGQSYGCSSSFRSMTRRSR
jgi:hypothetical protein